MKLGICCVYFFGPDSAWLLELQLRYIRETLRGYDYTVYAAANRLQPDLRERLEREARVEIVPLPPCESRESREHAFYLDLLLRHAAKEGCTHLAAVDADSFPVLDNWPQALIGRMTNTRIAAVLRTENLDTFLPHPCGLFMQRSFLLEHDPKLLPPKAEVADFMKATGQRHDTGIGYGYALWKSGERWLPLERSNAYDSHFLMAGIYGDVFFHLGAQSRRPWFYRDSRKKPWLKMCSLVRGASAPGSIPSRAGDWLEARYIKSNARKLVRICRALQADAPGFVAKLRGTAARRSALDVRSAEDEFERAQVRKRGSRS